MKFSLNRYCLGALSVVMLAIGIILALPVIADDDDDDSSEEEISIEELPGPIREALSGVEISEVDRIMRGDRIIFEVAIELSGDVEFELQLTRDAHLVGVEVEEGDEEEEDDDDEGEEEDDDDDERS